MIKIINIILFSTLKSKLWNCSWIWIYYNCNHLP